MHYIDKDFSPIQNETGGCLFAPTVAERSYATHNNFENFIVVVVVVAVVVVVVLFRKGDTGNSTCS